MGSVCRVLEGYYKDIKRFVGFTGFLGLQV